MPIGIAWTKNLPHGQLLSNFMSNFREIGIVDKQKSKYIEKQRSDCSTSSFKSTGLVNIVSAFAMLFGAAVASIAVCVGECLIAPLMVNIGWMGRSPQEP